MEDPSTKMIVLAMIPTNSGSVYPRMYLSRVNSPKAPRPVEKLPKISMITGHTVRKPTMAISVGVKTDRFLTIVLFLSYLVTSRQWSGSTVKLAISLTLMSESGSVLMKSWVSLIVISPSNASPMKTSD